MNLVSIMNLQSFMPNVGLDKARPKLLGHEKIGHFFNTYAIMSVDTVDEGSGIRVKEKG